MKTFEEFIIRNREHPAGMGGSQVVYMFPNGYGASVISGDLFYVDDEHPFELAVIQSDGGESYSLTYKTPITNDVIGHLDEQGVHDTLVQIKALPELGIEQQGDTK